MTTTASEAPKPLKRYRVYAVEWLSHRTVIEASSQEEAEAKGLEMFNDYGESTFTFSDSGLESVTAEEMAD